MGFSCEYSIYFILFYCILLFFAAGSDANSFLSGNSAEGVVPTWIMTMHHFYTSIFSLFMHLSYKLILNACTPQQSSLAGMHLGKLLDSWVTSIFIYLLIYLLPLTVQSSSSVCPILLSVSTQELESLSVPFVLFFVLLTELL